MIKNYIQKKARIQAIQLNFNTVDECLKFTDTSGYIDDLGVFVLDSENETYFPNMGDYIIKFEEGELTLMTDEEFNEYFQLEPKTYEVPRATMIRLEDSRQKGPATVYIRDGRVTNVEFDEPVTEGVKIDQAAVDKIMENNLKYDVPLTPSECYNKEPETEVKKKYVMGVDPYKFETPDQFPGYAQFFKRILEGEGETTSKGWVPSVSNAEYLSRLDEAVKSWSKDDGFVDFGSGEKMVSDEEIEKMVNQTEMEKTNAKNLANYIYSLDKDVEGVEQTQGLMEFLLNQLNK